MRPMGLAEFIIILFVEGLVVGALARLLLPGPDPMGVMMTATIGLFGSFGAGMFSWYVLHRHRWGLVLAVVFSMILVFLYRRISTASYRRGPRSRS